MPIATMSSLFLTLEDEGVDTTLLRSAWKAHEAKPDDVELAHTFRTLRVQAMKEMHTNRAVSQWVRAESAWSRMEDGPKVRMPRHG